MTLTRGSFREEENSGTRSQAFWRKQDRKCAGKGVGGRGAGRGEEGGA